MPLHPQMKAYLDLMAHVRSVPMETLTPQEARNLVRAAPRPPAPEPAKEEDRTIPGPHGDIPIRITWPKGKGPFPAFVWFHGGGWVIGSVALTDHLVRHFVHNVGCVGISVEYRLAPEHKFPCAVDDCYTAAKWAHDNAKAINVNPAKIAVGGDSAGGNLSACVALMARDKGGPKLVHQACIYPVIDRNFSRPSYVENAQGPVLTRGMMEWFWKLYLRTDRDASHPYVAPLNAADLRNLAPATVITAEYDPLRDEGHAWAKKLQQFGVPVDYKCYEGVTHGFVSMWSAVDLGKEGMEHVSKNLKKAFK
jgi:acetyl esterase